MFKKLFTCLALTAVTLAFSQNPLKGTISNLSETKGTKEVVAHLKKFGYAITENVIPSEECLLMAKAADQLEIQYTKGKKSSAHHHVSIGGGQTLIRNAHIELPILLPLIDHPAIWDVVFTVLNDTPILDGCSISRSGSIDGLIHDDGHLPVWDFEHTTDIVASVCLDDFTETNGGTIVWPLSHNSGIRPQNEFDPTLVPPGGLNTVTAIETGDLNQDGFIDLVLGFGAFRKVGAIVSTS